MTNSRTTLVCFAVKEESRWFEPLVRGHPEIQVLLTGMGRRNAEHAVTAAVNQTQPGLVITAGFAGGLSPDLAMGTVLFLAPETSGLEARLRTAGARPASFHCADAVVTTAQQKRALHAKTNADAVEMESQYIQMLCQSRGIPAATVRVILDTAIQDLALDFNRVLTPDQQIDRCKLALELVRSPMKIGALLRLQKQSANAAKRLAEVLGRVLGLR